MVLCTETTEQVLARQRFAEDNSRLSSLFEQAPSFMAVLSGPEHRFELINPGYQRLVGDRPVMGKTILEALPEVEGQGYVELLDQVFQTGEAFVARGSKFTRSPVAGAPGDDRYLDFVYQPIRDATGAVAGIFVEGYDVTERIIGERRQKLLVDELNHRVKNTLSTVLSLAMLSGKSAASAPQFITAFTDRIHAMAKTHDLVIKGATGAITVADVLHAELAPYIAADGQVELICDELTLAPETPVSLGLIVHELLTNAAKYGALSSPDGRLKVHCGRTPGGGFLDWRETVRHPLSPSDRKGFGTLLIDRLARELGGAARLNLEPAGLDARITFNLAAEA
jgi:two-component sensor histidine kinase